MKAAFIDGKNAKKWLIALLLVVLSLLSVYLLFTFAQEFFGGAGAYHGRHYDFLAFYSTGHFALNGNVAQIYNAEALTSFERTIVPHPVSALGYMPFLNPPFLAVLLAPLAALPIFEARVLWVLLNVGLMLSLAILLTKSIANKYLRALILMLIVCSYPVLQNLIQGQISIIILAGCLFSLLAYEKNKLAISGAWLSVLLIKPQLALFAVLGLLLYKQWQMLKGMATVGLIIAVITVPFTGIAPYSTYATFSSAVTSGHFSGAGVLEPTAWQGSLSYAFGLNGAFTSLFGQANVSLVNVFTAISALSLGLLLFLTVKKQKPGLGSKNARLVLASLIAGAMLVNPHAYAHDLILAFVLLAIVLPIWHKPTAILLFLTLLLLSYIDDMFGLHFTTLSLCLFAVYTYVAVYRLNTKNVFKTPRLSRFWP